MTKTVAIVGAGLSGATAAIVLARNGFDVEVFEQQDHVGGNCHTEREPKTGVMVHVHGPHIFHTNNAQVWDFVNQFDAFRPHDQRTKAIAGGQLYSFPINLHTLSEVFGRPFTPREAQLFIGEQARSCPTSVPLSTMEGYLLSKVGPVIYGMFFRDYTLKQWGRHPVDLPFTVAARIPVRFNYDDRVFDDRFQGIPRAGYTHLIEAMLDHPRIKVRFGEVGPSWRGTTFDHLIYTGPLDQAFDYSCGFLPYRSLEIAHEILPGWDDATGNSVINFCDAETKWTRQTEHRHFMPDDPATFGTVVSREFPVEWQLGATRYYPVRLAVEEKTLARYELLARKLDDVTFMGRLGTFRYLNMDQAVAAAISGTKEVMRRLR